jgi:hypothetical protein
MGETEGEQDMSDARETSSPIIRNAVIRCVYSIKLIKNAGVDERIAWNMH